MNLSQVKHMLIFILLMGTVTFGNADVTIPLLNSGKPFYRLMEYGLIKSDVPCFVMNQPYNYHTSTEILNHSGLHQWAENLSKKNSYFFGREGEDHLGIKLTPGLSDSRKQTHDISATINVDGIITIGDLLLINRFRLNDSQLKTDSEFHGDTGEWLYGYFDESYAILSISDKVELFMGRMKRNFGALDDYGLILSNNAYSFDHFGFTATGNNLKYSFYTTRLNDILGEDVQGATMPADTVMKTKRYWAIQRLDWRIKNNFQIALSEAIIYGGPDQNWVASYMNPVQFFYAAQRNQGVQLNSMWQINIFFGNPQQGLGFM